MVERGEFLVSVENGIWSTNECVTPFGVQPSRAFRGAKIQVQYKGGEALRWMNVDVYLVHHKARYESLDGDASVIRNRVVSGAEIIPVRFRAPIEAGSSHIAYRDGGGEYSKKYLATGFSDDYHALRVYGETASGSQFNFRIASESPAPLSEKKRDCFIACAAFDDVDHPCVDELRRVRDELLKPTQAGRAFIKFYYRHSPRVAAWMATRPRIKRATRAVLTPLARSTRALSSLRRAGWRSLLQNRL